MTENKKNMLEFQDWLKENGFDSGESYSYQGISFVFHDYGKDDDADWWLYWGYDLVKSLEHITLDEETKQFVLASVKSCPDGECGYCPDSPRGGSQTILGQSFPSLCSSIFRFGNLDTEAIRKLKNLLGFMKDNIDVINEMRPKYNAEFKEYSKKRKVEVSERRNAKLAELDKSFGNGKTKDVEPQVFSLPLKIELRAKTNETIRVQYHKGCVIFHAQSQDKDKLIVDDIISGTQQEYKKAGVIPDNELVDIEIVIGCDIFAVKVNDELRHIRDNYYYMNKIKDSPLPPAPVIIAASPYADLVVEKLRVTEV